MWPKKCVFHPNADGHGILEKVSERFPVSLQRVILKWTLHLSIRVSLDRFEKSLSFILKCFPPVGIVHDVSHIWFYYSNQIRSDLGIFFPDRILPIITSYSTLGDFCFVRSCSPWNVVIPSVPDVKSRDVHKRLNALETPQRISVLFPVQKRFEFEICFLLGLYFKFQTCLSLQFDNVKALSTVSESRFCQQK